MPGEEVLHTQFEELIAGADLGDLHATGSGITGDSGLSPTLAWITYLHCVRASYMYGAGDVRVIDVPDPQIVAPTDALVQTTRSCICGSDPHPYHSLPDTPAGQSMGHEFSAW